jgi:hypothetical protein
VLFRTKRKFDELKASIASSLAHRHQQFGRPAAAAGRDDAEPVLSAALPLGAAPVVTPPGFCAPLAVWFLFMLMSLTCLVALSQHLPDAALGVLLGDMLD